jgi:hypothetical protein
MLLRFRIHLIGLEIDFGGLNGRVSGKCVAIDFEILIT